MGKGNRVTAAGDPVTAKNNKVTEVDAHEIDNDLSETSKTPDGVRPSTGMCVCVCVCVCACVWCFYMTYIQSLNIHDIYIYIYT